MGRSQPAAFGGTCVVGRLTCLGERVRLWIAGNPDLKGGARLEGPPRRIGTVQGMYLGPGGVRGEAGRFGVAGTRRAWASPSAGRSMPVGGNGDSGPTTVKTSKGREQAQDAHFLAPAPCKPALHTHHHKLSHLFSRTRAPPNPCE